MTQGAICVNIQNIRIVETDIHTGICGIMIGPSRKSAHLERWRNDNVDVGSVWLSDCIRSLSDLNLIQGIDDGRIAIQGYQCLGGGENQSIRDPERSTEDEGGESRMRLKSCPYCGNAPVLYERDIFPRYMMKCDSDGKDCRKMCVRSDTTFGVDYKWEDKVDRTKSKIDRKIEKNELKIKSYREKREWRKKW